MRRILLTTVATVGLVLSMLSLKPHPPLSSGERPGMPSGGAACAQGGPSPAEGGRRGGGESGLEGGPPAGEGGPPPGANAPCP
jgi:hypothetical protein